MKETRALGVGFALVASLALTGVCFGQSAADSVVECTHVADKNARLRCYDEHMTLLGHKINSGAPAASVSVSPAAASALAPTPGPASVPASASVSKQAEFGIAPETLRKQRAAAEGTHGAESPELAAKVKAVSARAHGELSIELDNDQVWVETDHSGYVALAVNDPVTIKRGALGSYFLSHGPGAALRVKRVR